MVDAGASPAHVCCYFTDTVERSLSMLRVNEVVDPDLLRLTLGLPFLAGILEVAYQLLFLGIDRNDWVSRPLKLGNHIDDLKKLNVSIWMLPVFSVFRVDCRL